MPVRNPRIDSLTGVRAFAALWVVLLHFSDNTGIKGELDLGLIGSTGAWGVDVFFVLSGLILSYTYAPAGVLTIARYKAIVVKRFARVYPLHLATFLLMVVTWATAEWRGYTFQSAADYGAYSAALNLLFVQGWGLIHGLSWNGVSWSASAEWFAYLFVLPWCLTVGARMRASSVALLVAAWWLCLVMFAEGHGYRVVNVTSAGAVRIVPEFVLGFLIYREAARVRLGGDLLSLAGLAMITVSLVTGVEAGMLPSIGLLLLGLYRGGPLVARVFANRAAVFLGEISYSIYLVHPFVKIASDQAMRRAHLAVAPAVLLALDLALTVAAAYAAYALIEGPARRWVIERLGSGRAAKTQQLAADERFHVEPQ